MQLDVAERWCHRRRGALVLLAVLLISAGCGTDETPQVANDPSEVEFSSDTTTTSQAPPPSSTPSPTTVPNTSEPTPETIAEGRIPALPVLDVIELNQLHTLLTSYGNELLITRHGLVRAIDVDTGAERNASVAPFEGLRIEINRAVRAGDHHLAMIADSRGAFDVRLGFDLRSMQLTGGIPSSNGYALTWAYPGPNEQRILQYDTTDGVTWLDVTTMEKTGAPELPDTALDTIQLSDTGELAIWHEGGRIAIHDPETMEELGSVAVDTEPFSGSLDPLIEVSDRVIQYHDGRTSIGYIDRRTMKDLGFDPAFRTAGGEGFEVRYLSTQRNARLLAVSNGPERWYLLQLLDEDKGMTQATYVVADGSWDRGWTDFFLTPGLAWIDDRLFVQDHTRRIVEVDMSRVGEPTSAWVDPALPWTPDLTPEEQEIADLVIGYINDLEGARFTDRERSQEAFGAIQGYLNIGQGEWQVVDVLVDGGWAWSRALPDGPHLGYPVTLERVDGEWLVSTNQECVNAAFLSGAGC